MGKQANNWFKTLINEDDQIINSFIKKVVDKAPTDNQKLAGIVKMSRKLTKIMTKEKLLNKDGSRPKFKEDLKNREE